MWHQIKNFIPDNRLICGVLTVTSALLLAGALVGQYVGDLEPCSLCVIQRYPHIAVIIFGWLGYKRVLSDEQRKRLLWVIGLCLFSTAGIGFWHAGIEYGLYSGPPSCAGSTDGDSLETLRSQLLNSEIVRCDLIPWSLLGLSLAVYNGGISFMAGVLAFYAAQRDGKP